ncbi:MAG TPA: hypothetical protein DHU33_05365 [Firmicutes bacterium]|nr:hypothetical protein [Bacillota bacterium]
MEDKYNSDDKITLVQDTPITSLGSEINVENTNNDIGNNMPSDVEDRNQIETSENTLGNNESEISANNKFSFAEAVDNLDKTEVLDVVPSEPLVLSNDVNTTRVDASPVEDISNVDVPAQNIETQSNNVVSEAPQVTEEPAFSFDAPADVVDTANNDTQNQNNEDSVDTSNVSTPVDSENSPTTLEDVPSTNIEVNQNTQDNSTVEPHSVNEVPENNEVKEENNNDIVITSGNEEKTENKENPENTKQENTSVPEKKKKNKSDIVITLIAVLVVILGIAGLLYYFVFSKNTKSAIELGINTLSSKIYEINNNLHLNDLSKGIGSLTSGENGNTSLKSGSYEIKLDTNLEDFKNFTNYTYHFTYLNGENPKYNLKVVDNLFKNNVVNIDALGKDNKTYIRFNGVDANTYVTENDSNDIDVDNKIDINTEDLVDIDIEDLVKTITTSFKKNIKNVKVTKSTESIMINDVTYDTKKESLILTPTLLQNILNDVMDSNENYRDLLEDITFSDNVVIDFYVDKKTNSPIKIGYVNNDYDCDILFINDSLTLSLTSNADSSKVEMSIKTSSNSANMSMIVTSSLININLTADYSDLGTSMSSNIAVSLGNEEDTSNISLSIKGDYQNLESIKDIDISNPKDLSEFNIENYRFSFIGTPFYNMFF